jgi:signal transduction histidine kinase
MTAQLIENGMFSLSPETCDLVELLRGVLCAFGPRLAATGITLRVEGADQPVDGFCDPKRMTQVLTNVIGNALKFSPAGTVVDVELAVDDVCARFIVRDQGPGIPEDQLERIFEKYVQVDGTSNRRQEGMGLGLMIARSIVQAHGGTIMIQSKLGVGSCFVIELPREAVEGLRAGAAPYILV